MKITSINFVDTASIPLWNPRNTQRAKDIQTIIENLSKAPAGKSLVIAGTDIKKFERYHLQKALQKAGAKVTVSNGKGANGADVLNIRKLSEAEWKEYLKNKAD